MIFAGFQKTASTLLRAGLFCVVLGFASRCFGEEASESNVKAAFIYNFLKFIELPASQAASRLVVCVAGDSQAEALRRLAGRNVRGLNLQVKRIFSDSDLGDCPVVFFGADSSLQSSAKRLSRSGVLTIGESPRFLANGGIINFFKDKDRVRFEISPAHANWAGIRMSSQLLNLARIADASL